MENLLRLPRTAQLDPMTHTLYVNIKSSLWVEFSKPCMQNSIDDPPSSEAKIFWDCLCRLNPALANEAKRSFERGAKAAQNLERCRSRVVGAFKDFSSLAIL